MDKKNTNRKKRIAFYIGSLGKGGAERVIRNLAEFFYEQGYEVFMVTKLREENEYSLNPGIRRIIADISKEEETGSRVGNLKARIRKLREIWQEIEPDVIVSFIKKNNLMALASAKPLKIPVLVSVRSAPERELSGRGVKPLSFFMFRWAAGLILQTSQAKEFFPANLQKKAIILPNSINREFIQYLEDNEKQTHVQTDYRIITVGRIDDNKNQKMLVEAFIQLAKDYPEWSLHLYGNGESMNKVKALAEGSDFVSRIIFHGVVDNVAEEMSKAEMFVLPSRVEGMPNALIEAMAMGKACISTDCPCGGPADIIDDGKSGILIAVDDRQALAEAMSKLMSDKELRARLGEEALAIRESLSPDKVNSQWKEYIESIIG